MKFAELLFLMPLVKIRPEIIRIRRIRISVIIHNLFILIKELTIK